MKQQFSVAIITLTFLTGSVAYAGNSSNNKIPEGNALLLGGTQPSRVDFDGQNRGSTDLELVLRNGDTEKRLAVITPREGFTESIPKYQTLVIKNLSDTQPAKVYWHISGYSKQANPRIEVHKD